MILGAKRHYHQSAGDQIAQAYGIFWRYCAADVQISQIPFYPQMGLGQHSLQAIADAGRIYGYSLIWATLVRFS